MFSGLVLQGDFSTWTARDFVLGAPVAAPTLPDVGQALHYWLALQNVARIKKENITLNQFLIVKGITYLYK